MLNRTSFAFYFSIMIIYTSSAYASLDIIDKKTFLNCAIQRYGEVNSQPLVNAQYQRSIASSAFQFGFNGDIALEATVPTQGESTADNLAYDFSIAKPLYNHSASLKIRSSESALKSIDAEFRSALMQHLLTLNGAVLRIRTLLIEKGIVEAQVKQLTELHQFAERLRRSKVIDPADALLVNENLIRFQLRLIEVDEELTQSISEFEVKSGLPKSRVRQNSNATDFSVKKIESDFQRAMSAVRAAEANRETLPPVAAATYGVTAFDLDLKSKSRAWYPFLTAGAGFRRSIASISSGSIPSESYLGLNLKFELPIDERLAEMERARALGAIAANQVIRSNFELQSYLQAKIDQLGLLKTQFSVAQERLGNLERLLDLQLIKFKSGKLSFLNVNDVMLSLLEARRQLSSSRARINAIEMDGQIMSMLVEPLDLKKLDCR